ncbi:hypothetical protein LEP1GSC126_0064 [Leptospira kirschneri str. 200801774]|nr:hypothetical protein LEP1GSC126_0064 [Leptospira kirschneri str. 200801774]
MSGLRRIIKKPIIEKADVLKETTISRSDYSQVGRVPRRGGVRQANFNELHSGICRSETRKPSLTCERERTRSGCDCPSGQKNSRSIIRENFEAFKNRSNVNKKSINVIDKINIILTLSLRIQEWGDKMSFVLRNINRSLLGYSDDGPTVTKNRFHSNKATSRKSGFGRIGQANSNGLYPILCGSEKRKCGSACKNEWHSTRNNFDNYNRNWQFIFDGTIGCSVRNDSENSNVLKINTLVLDNILNFKTLSLRNSKFNFVGEGI